MAPRRHRRKLGLSRMDAAIDAMLPYGFDESHVRKVVRLLLKEYGGNEGWPFIEEFSYKELIEAMLRDQETCDQKTDVEAGNPSQDKSFRDEESHAGTSSRAPDIQHDGLQDSAAADFVACSGAAAEPAPPEFFFSTSMSNNAEADGKGKNILLDQTGGHDEEAATLMSESDEDPNPMTRADSPGISRILASPSPDSTPSQPPTDRQRHQYCHGWIESDEDNDDDYIYLKPASAALGPKASLA